MLLVVTRWCARACVLSCPRKYQCKYHVDSHFICAIDFPSLPASSDNLLWRRAHFVSLKHLR